MSVITMAYAKNTGWLKSLYLQARKLSWKGVIFFLVGTFLLFFFSQQWLIGFASLNWQTTQGKIITSQAVPCVHKYFPNRYEAKIVYEYSVNGISYSSSNVTFTTDSVTIYCGNAEKLTAQYPFGKSVLVYYDPANPENSVLRPGGTSFMSVAISLGLLVYGIKLFVSESDFTKPKITKRNLKKQSSG